MNFPTLGSLVHALANTLCKTPYLLVFFPTSLRMKPTFTREHPLLFLLVVL